MKRQAVSKATVAEEAYIRDLSRASAFEKLDRGEASIVPPNQYPEPIRRFLAREREAIHIRLAARTRRRLTSLSRSMGVPVDELARRWVEEGLSREAS